MRMHSEHLLNGGFARGQTPELFNISWCLQYIFCLHNML